MPFNHRIRRAAAVTSLGVALAGGATFATLSADPALAAGVIAAVTTTTCSVTGANWCISGNNTSSGIGVIGTSKTGTGLRGTSTSQYGLKATSVSGDAILAQTTSGATAISATSGNNGRGVSGTGGVGLYGTTTNSGYGVYGATSSGAGYGVVGIAGTGDGTYGGSSSGDGVYGFSSTGIGGYFLGGSYGVVAHTGGGTTVFAQNTNGSATDFRATYIALLGRAPALGFPLALTDPAGNNLFYVDGSGNVSYHGGLFHFATAAGGATVRSFSPNTTLPTVEDTGTAQLTAGVAAVRLDPAFAASIDPSTQYRVFVTPNGDTHGLFVATKTAAGFIVREAQAGRSTVTFDYRIVATALGQTGQRMAVVSRAGAAFAPVAAAAAGPAAARIPAAVQAPAAEPATP
jgi:hypothetical protein